MTDIFGAISPSNILAMYHSIFCKWKKNYAVTVLTELGKQIKFRKLKQKLHRFISPKRTHNFRSWPIRCWILFCPYLKLKVTPIGVMTSSEAISILIHYILW
jgi:hypothetical protein